MDKLQAIAGRVSGGVLKLREWMHFLLFGFHDQLTKSLSTSPELWAAGIEIISILLLLLLIWMLVWPRRFKAPFQPPEEIHPAHPYRLLILAGIIALVFLAACIAAE